MITYLIPPCVPRLKAIEEMGVAVERMPSAQLKAGVQRCEEEGDVRKSFLKALQQH